MPSAVYHKLNSDVRPLSNGILVTDMEQGDKIVNGLILLDDNGKQTGIHPRWCRVYKVGDKIDFVKPGDWILVEHGRWSFGVKMALPGKRKKNTYNW